jgi:DNA-binding NarL/FixJ family response regulator
VEFLKILVVEDFQEFRKAICSVLQLKPEFQVEVASDGLEAVQKVEELQPHLILLDIGLPKLNGLEVAKRAHKLVPSAKILFLSVESDADLVKEALRLGSGYVHKPRVGKDLLPAIQAVLRGEPFVSTNLLPSGATDETQRRHVVQFCSSDSSLLESFTGFIAKALETGNAAIVLATQSHRQTIVERLKAGGSEVDSAMQRGTYVSLDAEEMLSTIMSNGVPDVAKFSEGLRRLIEAAAQGTKKENPLVAICGECVDLLLAAGNVKAAIQLEKAGQDLIRKHNVEVLCAYRASSFANDGDKQAFRDICAEHTAAHFK